MKRYVGNVHSQNRIHTPSRMLTLLFTRIMSLIIIIKILGIALLGNIGFILKVYILYDGVDF